MQFVRMCQRPLVNPALAHEVPGEVIKVEQYCQSHSQHVVNAGVDSQCTHDYVPLAAPWKICWHPKDFPMSPKVDAEVGETPAGFIRWLTMRSRMSRCFYDICDVLRSLTNFGRVRPVQSCVHLQSTSAQCEAVYPHVHPH